MRNEKGVTIIEVVIAFLVLMIGIGIFAQAISTASSFSRRAQARVRGNQAAADSYYTAVPEGVTAEAGAEELTLTGEGTTVKLFCRTGKVKSDDTEVANGNQTAVSYQVYVPAKDPVAGP